MLKLRKVAVTGGLSCGKSSVCRILRELGAYVVSADKIVHQLLSSDTNLGQKIVTLLGNSVMINRKLDRSRIGSIVFHDLKLLNAYEALVHPAVYEEIEREYQKQKGAPQPPPLFVAEIPLLYESGGKRDFDSVILVDADVEKCSKRFMQETGYDQHEFNRRMARLLPLKDKIDQADYIITNNGSLSDLKQNTREIYQKLIEG